MSKTKASVPTHVAIIMDGNRRWARQNKLQIFKGHEKVAKEVIQALVDRCLELKISYLTLWAFSTENWKRSQREVDAILNLLRDMFIDGREALEGRDVKINTIGELARFPEDIQQGIVEWKEESKNAQSLTVTFALNYGGRDEILRAIRQLMLILVGEIKGLNQSALAKKIAELTTEKFLSAQLDTTDLPDPDLIIRTGGEQRLSGFMPWQSAYAEFYFTKVLMPDFGAEQLDLALKEYACRERRFGK